MKNYTTKPQIKKSGITIYKVLLCLIFSVILSCNGIEENTKQIISPEIEKNLMDLCDMKGIPTDNSKVLIIPTSECKSCKAGAKITIGKIDSLFIIYSESDSSYKKMSSQVDIPVNPYEVEKRGLTKLYSSIYYIRNKKVDSIVNDY